MSAVLDASACLAYLQREAGAEVVAEFLIHGAYISAVNLAEVLSKLAEWGQDPEEAYIEMMNRGLLGGMLEATRLLPEGCAAIARLHPMSKDLGLSLGDRACLALGVRLGLPVLTADREWRKLALNVEVRVVR